MRPCIEPACPRLTPRTRCAKHERQRDRTRRPPDQYPHEYRVNRALVLAESDVCWRCGKAGATTADHVIPIAHGGTHERANLRPAHLACNSSAGANVRR